MAVVKVGDRLLTPEEIAEIVGMSPRWVKRESRAYGLPLRRIGGSPRCSERELYDWINQQPTI
ncbi:MULTISPECIES: helix-turn-helix domain-containing protein [Streptosporangium]|uniref:DNA-binding protein n=1 Tax=Streptosporangium brasiliense TaxID=47480 RepID=A0ABT9RM28_9ACTN|nr:helix-turn-helix domain-containing protein [Streptosporangium brasiliense]MDP9870348.1 hypothetical protein [Streptosporangium brasiliense]